MRGHRFEVEVPGGRLVGCVRGDGVPVLLLHGGPGLSGDFFDDLVDELEDGYRVAWFQQRGLEPSSLEGPFDMPTAVADAVAALDALGWDRAVVGGFSYGGNLLLHVLAEHPERLLAALAVDPLGGVGDGGEEEFGARFLARLPADRVAALEVYAARQEAGEVLSDEEALDELRLYWPGYFADPAAAPPLPDGVRISARAHAAQYQAARDALPGLAARIAGSAVPTLFVHGGESPMPVSASTDTAAAIGASASVVVVPGSGHFVWHESPGAVRRALDALVSEVVSS